MSDDELFAKLVAHHWIKVDFRDLRECGCGARFEGENAPSDIRQHFLSELFSLWSAHDERGQILEDRRAQVDYSLLTHDEDSPEWLYALGQMDVIEENMAYAMNELWDRYLA
ncbi:hypothetical protein [Nocardia sp. NPDC057440]|uniref:hypothetical protein n=1 Tax=Nocardia sp. NPDC057440 TaxID=3346134 RepID=UPI00366FF307